MLPSLRWPLLALTLLLAACDGRVADERRPAPRSAAPVPVDARPPTLADLRRDLAPSVSPGDLAAAVAGNTAFATDLYGRVRTAPGNLFFSPHSVATALSMTLAGARGTTASQMAGALHVALPLGRQHAARNLVDLSLARRASVATGRHRPFQLTTVNTTFAQDGASLQAPFLDTLATSYGAGVRNLDFGDPVRARAVINAWVSDATRQMIPELIADGVLDQATRLVLVNAITFRGAWATPFATAATAARPFAAPTGTVDIPTLRQVAHHRHGVGRRFRAAELAYDGGQLSMVVVLPELLPGERGDPLPRLEAELDAARMAEIRASLRDATVALELPVFRIRSPLSLDAPLRALGVTDAFSDRADFSGITGDRSLRIDAVVHQAYIAIDEAGTEAAAATAVAMATSLGPPPVAMTVDRPFLFFIVDRPTGEVLFLGRVVDPR